MIGVETIQIEAVLVMCVGLIALSFAHFPVYPLHAPQTGPQKTSQIYVLLLQVASLGDFSGTSGFILTTFPKIRFKCGDILMYQMLF